MAKALAGLLASAVMGIAKDKLASAIADKANLLWNFNADLEDMEETLKTISAALQEARREKLVQLLLKRLKIAALDLTDMLQDYHDTRMQLTAKIPRAVSCLPIACKKISLATRMKSMREELNKINKQFQDFNFKQGASITSTEQHGDVRETSSCLPDQPIIGRNVEKKEIRNLLSAGTNNEETSIVAICGLGGMDKSTLAQQIYNDVHFKKYDHRIWVYVSPDFSLKKIGSSIISLLPIEGSQQNRDILEAVNQCLDIQLHGKKVLIVLDDLWEEKDTELGKLRSMLHVDNNDSMIDVIVTTRSEHIARKVSTCEPYMLHPLKDATCWEIIKRISKFEQEHNQQGFKQIGLDIAKKCGGVPLAAQAVGYLLQYKQLSEWTEINNSDTWNEYSEDNVRVLLAPRMQNEVLPEYITKLEQLQYLNLNGSSGISALPESISKLARCLEFLGLSGCSGISELPSSFGDLKCLKHLNMSGCSGINELPDSLGDLTNLQHLELSQCSRLQVIPESLCALTHLQYLSLSSCERIKRLPKAIGSLVYLQHLNMSGCGVRALPESFKRLGNLLHLELTGCFIKKRLVGALCRLTALQHLSLSTAIDEENLEMDDLPDAMRYLTNLKHLDLSACNDSLENNDGYLDFIGTLTNLEHLNLSMNVHLGYLPESIGNLKRLHTLNLKYCQSLKSFPESIGGATGLKSLLLDECSPELIDQASSLFHYSLTLPLFKVRADDVSAKSNLHLLQGESNIGELKIVSLENVIFLEEAQRLKLVTKQNLVDLTLSWAEDANRLVEDKYLFEELVPPMSLKSFRLEGYSSPSYPSWIMDNSHHLPTLQKLDFCKCPNLTSLPEGIRQLSSLQFLRLECCDSISALPEWLSDISSLKKLNIWGCTSIKSLPSCIHQLTDLQELFIFGNKELGQWCKSEENKAKLAHIKDVVCLNKYQAI